jgi:hydrogenase maturation factor
VTIGLDRPIISGAMLGEVERDQFVTGAEAGPGDAVILTKGIAIEGTTVLAREADASLRRAGIPDETVASAANFIKDPGISIVREATAACRLARVHAMHDPTEGGLATALRELSAVCHCRVQIERNAVNVLSESRVICDALGLDPLGLLGLLASGALLIVTAESDCERVIVSIEEADVPAQRIGSLIAGSEDAIMLVNGEPRALPQFERDEVARYFSEQGGTPI